MVHLNICDDSLKEAKYESYQVYQLLSTLDKSSQLWDSQEGHDILFKQKTLSEKNSDHASQIPECHAKTTMTSYIET